MAQWLAHWTFNPEVEGSSPSGSGFFSFKMIFYLSTFGRLFYDQTKLLPETIPKLFSDFKNTDPTKTEIKCGTPQEFEDRILVVQEEVVIEESKSRRWEVESSISHRPYIVKSEKIQKEKLKTQKNLLYQADVDLRGAVEKIKQCVFYKFKLRQSSVKHNKPIHIGSTKTILPHPLLLYLYFLFPFLPESSSNKFYKESVNSRITSPPTGKAILSRLFYQNELISLEKGKINDTYSDYFGSYKDSYRKLSYSKKENRNTLEQNENSYIKEKEKEKEEKDEEEVKENYLIKHKTLINLQIPAFLLLIFAGGSKIRGAKINKVNNQEEEINIMIKEKDSMKKEGKGKEIYLINQKTLINLQIPAFLILIFAGGSIIRGAKINKVNIKEVENEIKKKKLKEEKTEESKKLKKQGIIKKTQKLKEEDIDHKGKRNRKKYLRKIKGSTNNITNKVESKNNIKYGSLNTKEGVIENDLTDLLHSVKLTKMKAENKRSQREMKSQKKRINIINLHNALRRRIHATTRKKFLVVEKVGTL